MIVALTFPCLKTEVVSHPHLSGRTVKPGSCTLEGETRRDVEAGFGGLFRAVSKLSPTKLENEVITAHSHSFMGLSIQYLCVPGILLN